MGLLINEYMTVEFSVIHRNSGGDIVNELHNFKSFGGAAAYFLQQKAGMTPGESLTMDTGNSNSSLWIARYDMPEEPAPEAETIATMPLADRREIAAVLAGLRMIQESAAPWSPGIDDILTDCGAFEQLNNIEIDDLCERINS